MNIAIVEDFPQEVLVLKQKLKQYMEEKQLDYHLSVFSSAESFIESLTNTSYRIVFMDIYLKTMTGMEAARILRSRDRYCKLIFLTSSEDFIRQGYSVDAAHYLLKPLQDELFLEAMENCHLIPPRPASVLNILVDKTPVSLNTDQLLYISVYGRNLEFHLFDQTLISSGTFSGITRELLYDPRFLIPIRGTIINMDFILTHDKETAFILSNGDRIPITFRNRKKIIQAWRSYMFNQLGETATSCSIPQSSSPL